MREPLREMRAIRSRLAFVSFKLLLFGNNSMEAEQTSEVQGA